MEVIESDKWSFDEIIKNPYNAYSTGMFAELNEEKVDKVYFLLFKDSKYRLGVILGVNLNEAKSPFSAPFGGFIPIKKDVKLEVVESALFALENWLRENKIKNINITLPPNFYDPNFIGKQVSVLYRNGYKIENVDLNYHLVVDNLNSNDDELISRAARKNLNIALRSGLNLKLCTTSIEKKIAYDIIKQNREERSFPLRMSWESVVNTIQIIDADFFLCSSLTDSYVGSAMVFYVADKIVQIIYWGDLREYSSMKPMNFLSHKLHEFYIERGVRIIDIGPSTDKSMPNYGLCDFKESIGCEISTKYSFKKSFLGVHL